MILKAALLMAAAGPATFEPIRPLVRQNRVDDALRMLPSPDGLPLEDKALAQFLKGRLLYQQARFHEALPLFQAAVADKHFRLSAYAHYHIGLIQLANKDYEHAKVSLTLALKREPNRDLQSLAELQLADMALELKHYDEAGHLLRTLEKRWKHDVRFPEVLYRELKVEMRKNRAARLCKIARKLYADFPGHPLVSNWTIQLRDSKVDDRTLGCLVASKDQIRRIRRLQWAGLSDRARSEIEYLRSKEKGPVSYFLDSMLAQFLISEGLVDEAMKVLLKHYELQKNSFSYLNLLARAAARAGEYQTAVGAYYKAYHLAQRSRAGREALFQSAFLSYQFQDYDGAARKFQEFTLKYARSGLRRDAQWHMAWIRYLKGDYQGALRGFDTIQARTTNLRRHRRMASDRIRYWQAMALMRLERYDEARSLFQTLNGDKSMGYYSVAAHHRIESLPVAQVTPPLVAAIGPAPSATPPALTQAAVEPEAGSKEEEESEDSMTIARDENSKDEDAEDSMRDSDEDPRETTPFKNVRLMAAFDRAGDLIKLGLFDWARWELFEIESRTRNKTYLANLMALYEKIDSFNRSSSIGDLRFANERQSEGLDRGKGLWQSAYPQAFKSFVLEDAKKFEVAPELVWSIMRAESQYKTDVISPVGAKGLMQLMPQTGGHLANLLGQKDFVESQLLDPEVNIRLGSKYLSRLSSKFDRAIPLVAAAYNAGPHRVESWLMSFGTVDTDEFIEHIPFVETRDYVKKVVRNYSLYLRLYQMQGLSLGWLAKPMAVKVPKKASARETWEI